MGRRRELLLLFGQLAPPLASCLALVSGVLLGDSSPALSFALLAALGGLAAFHAHLLRNERAGLWSRQIIAVCMGLALLCLIQLSGGVASPAVHLLHPFALALGLLFGPWEAGGVVAGLLLLTIPGFLADGAPMGPAEALWGLAPTLMALAVLPHRFRKAEQVDLQMAHGQLRSMAEETRALQRDLLRSSSTADEEAPLNREQLESELRAQSMHLGDSLNLACGLLQVATGAERCLLYRWDVGDDLRLVAWAGEIDGVLPAVSARQGVLAVVREVGQLHMEGSAQARPDFAYLAAGESEPNSFCGRLVNGPGGAWGVLILEARAERPLGSQGALVAEELSGLVERLIEQTVAASTYRRRLRESEAFATASRALSRHVREDELAGALVAHTEGFAASDVTAVVMARGDSLHVIATSGIEGVANSQEIPLESSEGLIAQAVLLGAPIHRTGLSSTGRTPLLLGRELGDLGSMDSVLVLPLLSPSESGQGVLGAFLLARKNAPGFTPEERQRVEVLLSQATALVLNARLFREQEARATTDGMTGLPNHRSFRENLGQMTQRADRCGHPISLLLIDVDHFKSVNDTYGHPVGDQVLKRLGTLLAREVRDGTDMAARYGGEEFCVLLEGTDLQGAEQFADRIREVFAAERFACLDSGQPTCFQVTMSIGVSSYPLQAGTGQQLIDRADQALYQAKENGRNRVVGWSPEAAA